MSSTKETEQPRDSSETKSPETMEGAPSSEQVKEEDLLKDLRNLELKQQSASATADCRQNIVESDDPSNVKDEADNFLSDAKDALGFGKTIPIKSRTDAEMPVGRLSPNYNMKHKKRGLAVIISYSEFSRGGPPARACAFHDSRICEEAFKSLRYDVKTYENLPRRNFVALLEQVQNTDHSHHDSLAIVFMSHGGVNEKINQEYLWLYDSMINTSELWKNFTAEKCPSLAGKPKLFFIQACRGEDVDKGVQLKKKKTLSVQVDSITIPKVELEVDYAIPLNADMLMMWASFPGMFAFKSNNKGLSGSVFLHFLSQVLKEDASRDDLMSMLVRVTREVAIHYESYVPGDRILDKNKQIPQLQSTLMRKVKFF